MKKESKLSEKLIEYIGNQYKKCNFNDEKLCTIHQSFIRYCLCKIEDYLKTISDAKSRSLRSTSSLRFYDNVETCRINSKQRFVTN